MTFLERRRADLFVGLGLVRRAMTLGVKAYLTDPADPATVLLVRHTYVRGWHLPGGGVERGETVWNAVAKEVREETHMALTARPQLFGLYRNGRTSRFDHVAMFVGGEPKVARTFRPNWEIAECRFFALDALPDGTTQATHDRVREVTENLPPADHW